jgi:ankyrin repeat protein
MTIKKVRNNKISKNDINNEILNNFKKIQLFNDLINLIKQKKSKEALLLLNNNKIYSSFCKLTIEGFTPLMYACMYELEDVALSIINTGYSNANHVSNSNFTALIYAIYNNLEKIAKVIITNFDFNLEHIDQFGNNALIHACKSGNENIALFIIRTNMKKCNFMKKNNIGKNALMYAVEKNLDIVSYELNKIYYPPWIKY